MASVWIFMAPTFYPRPSFNDNVMPLRHEDSKTGHAIYRATAVAVQNFWGGPKPKLLITA